jgi:hypothetical protein
MQAIETPGMIKMARPRFVDGVVVTTKKNDLALTAIGGNQCGMNSNNIIR